MAKAKVIDKTFNLDHGCIHFTIQDHLGRNASLTAYITQPDGSPNDVEALLEQHLQMVDTHAGHIEAAFRKHGWNGHKAG